MRRTSIPILLILFVLIGVPAYAYADPTGGALFQVLMPTLAAIWGVWLIFANKLRRAFATLLRKLRGTSPEESPAE